MSLTWASSVLSQDVCQLCGHDFKAAGSNWCAGCEREILVTSIDRHARNSGVMMPWKPRRRHNPDLLWCLILGFAAGTLAVTLLWMISGLIQ